MTQQLDRMEDGKDSTRFPVAATPKDDALVRAVSQREVAEAQGMMLVAQRFPRDEAAARERILIACQRPGLAEAAIYTYPRGGTQVTGPSIRLAEAFAQIWGNLQFGIRELEQSAGRSTMEAYAWDLEHNVRQVKVFQVRHLRHAQGTVHALETPRDIYEEVANQGARRMRACILGLIPGDIVEDAVAECEKTLKTKADTSPAALKKMVTDFAAFGVTKEQIEGRLQRRLDAITPAQKINLVKVYNSMKDGMSVAADWFGTPGEAEEKRTGNAGVKEALKKGAAKAKAAEQSTPTPESEEKPEPSGRGALLNQIEEAITMTGDDRQRVMDQWADSVKREHFQSPNELQGDEPAAFLAWITGPWADQ